jgi:hypothetical protein
MERPVHLQVEAWLEARPELTASSIARALAILDRPSAIAPEAGDELPEGYESIRDTEEYQQAIGVK